MDSEKCTLPGCGNLYEMQSPEALTRPENPNPKWPVPKDLIELQPSYKQAGLFLIFCVSTFFHLLFLFCYQCFHSILHFVRLG